MAYLALVITAVMVFSLGWTIRRQEEYQQKEFLHTARLIVDQFVAMRSFIAASQDRINYDSAGNFEFKGLNPAAVGKGVADIFNQRTEFKLKQTRLNPRNHANMPDSFERQKLAEFAQNRGLSYLWGKDVVDGQWVLRYMVPLYIEPPCLACHGDLGGATDVTGHQPEGYRLGEFTGAISVSVPAEGYYAALWGNIIYQIILFTAVLLLMIVSIHLLQRRLVTVPLEKLSAAAARIGQGNFEMPPDNSSGGRGEIGHLERSLYQMAQELSGIYGSLENQVQERTACLEKERNTLSKMNKKLTKLNKLQSEFLTNVSHELRTPLTSILAFTELLEQNSGLSDEERRQNLRDINESAGQLLQMINNLLDAARLEAGRIRLEKRECHPAKIAGESARAVMPLAAKKGLLLCLDVASDMPAFLADEERIRQVLINLLGNAVKFTPAGGKITLGAGLCPGQESLVRFWVTDTGPGINRQEQTRIFARFRQGESALAGGLPGSGLGLYLSKKMVEMHGGTIEVNSETGQGATFLFTLPVGGSADAKKSSCG
jgi:signal transduction histidine kinase